MDISAMMNVVTTQRRRYCTIIPMKEFCNTNALMVQRCRFYASISMITFTMMNVLTMQRHKFYTNISTNIPTITNDTTMQRRRCCSFDSPGLARNEPTPGKRSQGDSTP